MSESPASRRRRVPLATRAAVLLVLLVAPVVVAPDGAGPGPVAADVGDLAGLVADPDCGGDLAVPGGPGPTRCAQGDPLAPDLDPAEAHEAAGLARLVARADEAAAAGVAPSVPCFGDGTTGERVQAVYAVAADVPNRYAEVEPLVTGFAALAADAFVASSSPHGVRLEPRFVTRPECGLEVAEVVLTPEGDDSFAAVVGELALAGLARPDRKYLVWLDATSDEHCGVGSYFVDDRPAAEGNWNDGAAALHGVVYAGCWGLADAPTEAHELMHTLGAVQPSAPNATGSGHCTDENDRMCLADGPDVALSYPCPPEHERRFDCGGDDYFDPDPPPGSYLAERWNPATSRFLERGDPAAPPPAVHPHVPASGEAGTALAVSVVATPAAGRTATVAWRTSSPACTVADPAATSTTLVCGPAATGPVRVEVVVTDSAGVAATGAALHLVGPLVPPGASPAP